MKKFLLLIVLCVIKLNVNAYEYLIIDDPTNYKVWFVDNVDGYYGCVKRYDYNSGLYTYTQTGNIIQNFSLIKSGYRYYINKDIFDSYYKNDEKFINDLYLTNTEFLQGFLNYLYNSSFTSISYIIYENYKILYNYDGLAVVSIVNGQWAGLYDNSTIAYSGNLYDSNGSLAYVDGQEPSFFQKLWVKLSEPLMKDFMDANSGLMPLKWILAFIIIFMLVYFCIRLYKNAIGVEKWKI